MTSMPPPARCLNAKRNAVNTARSQAKNAKPAARKFRAAGFFTALIGIYTAPAVPRAKVNRSADRARGECTAFVSGYSCIHNKADRTARVFPTASRNTRDKGS